MLEKNYTRSWGSKLAKIQTYPKTRTRACNYFGRSLKKLERPE